jgi:hypothetical protein
MPTLGQQEPQRDCRATLTAWRRPDLGPWASRRAGLASAGTPRLRLGGAPHWTNLNASGKPARARAASFGLLRPERVSRIALPARLEASRNKSTCVAARTSGCVLGGCHSIGRSAVHPLGDGPVVRSAGENAVTVHHRPGWQSPHRVHTESPRHCQGRATEEELEAGVIMEPLDWWCEPSRVSHSSSMAAAHRPAQHRNGRRIGAPSGRLGRPSNRNRRSAIQDRMHRPRHRRR